MKHLTLIAACLITGCTVTVKPPDEVVNVINAQAKEIQKLQAVANLITNYIADCQSKGVCPKPDNKQVSNSR